MGRAEHGRAARAGRPDRCAHRQVVDATACSRPARRTGARPEAASRRRAHLRGIGAVTSPALRGVDSHGEARGDARAAGPRGHRAARGGQEAGIEVIGSRLSAWTPLASATEEAHAARMTAEASCSARRRTWGVMTGSLGLDIWVSSRAPGDTGWTAPVNLEGVNWPGLLSDAAARQSPPVRQLTRQSLRRLQQQSRHLPHAPSPGDGVAHAPAAALWYQQRVRGVLAVPGRIGWSHHAVLLEQPG